MPPSSPIIYSQCSETSELYTLSIHINGSWTPFFELNPEERSSLPHHERAALRIDELTLGIVAYLDTVNSLRSSSGVSLPRLSPAERTTILYTLMCRLQKAHTSGDLPEVLSYSWTRIEDAPSA